MPIHEYLNKLKGHLERAANEAKLLFNVQQGRMAYQYNLILKEIFFQVDDKVILLIPDSTNKLCCKSQGSETIVEK